MTLISCIIIEDEPLAMERTRSFVLKTPYLDLRATFENALSALDFLRKHQIDLLFLDINMDELSGIEFLESTDLNSQVIFTTAYQQYALKGYELNITDYLLKPFTFQRFLQAVNKVHLTLHPANTNNIGSVFIKTENRLENVRFSDIIYIEGMRDYRRIHTTTKSIMTLQNFKELEQLIPSHIICRVHKSYMVALDKIESIEKGRIKIHKKSIPISASYRDHFHQLIKSKS